MNSAYLLPLALLAACHAGGPAPRAATPASPGARLTEAQALARVEALPEVRAYGETLRTPGRNLALRVEQPPAASCGAADPRCAYELLVGEDTGERVTTWNRFQVHAFTGTVSAYDPVNDRVLSLEAWRAERAAQR